MKRWLYRIITGLALAGAILVGNAWLTGGLGSAGEADTAAAAGNTALPPAWESMTTGTVLITPSGGEQAPPTRRLAVRIADDSAERAQGMQHLPARVVRDHPIWFVFPEPRRVGWHMQNVRAPLDIAYVDADGVVIGVERMTPGGSGYGISAEIAAALEVAAGQAERLGITPGTRLTLQRE